jgi:hypothetical protein
MPRDAFISVCADCTLNQESIMLKKIAVAMVAAMPAHAGGHVSLSLGVGLPIAGVYAAPAPAYYGPPAPVYYGPPAVAYDTPYPVAYPAYYGPGYYGPPAVVRVGPYWNGGYYRGGYGGYRGGYHGGYHGHR